MNKLVAIISLFLLSHSITAQTNPWDLFEQCTWRDEYIEEYFSYATLLEYNDFVKEMEGQEMILSLIHI